MKDFLELKAKQTGCKIDWDDPEDVIDTIEYLGEKVDEKTIDSRRWYDKVRRVFQIEGRYFACDFFYTTGDTDWSDMGLEYDEDSYYEVERKEVVSYEYSPI